MSAIVIFPDQDKVSIYGHCLDDPQPMFIESCYVKDAERRLAQLSHVMGRAWHLSVWRKVTLSKNTGFQQTRHYEHQKNKTQRKVLSDRAHPRGQAAFLWPEAQGAQPQEPHPALRSAHATRPRINPGK